MIYSVTFHAAPVESWLYGIPQKKNRFLLRREPEYEQHQTHFIIGYSGAGKRLQKWLKSLVGGLRMQTFLGVQLTLGALYLKL